MGTTFRVTVVGETLSADSAEHLRVEIDDLLASLDARMSTYDSGSEVSRFNAWTSSDWFPVSVETATVYLRAKEISEVTGGAFDVTVGPLVDAWGFGPLGPQPTSPSDSDIADLLTTVGFMQIEIDESIPAIRKTHVGVRSDLSAVAKGYAVDRVGDFLSAGGYNAYFIEIGGEIRTLGRRAGGQPWRVGIEQPTDGPASLQRVIELSDAALATSGDYRNYIERDGVRISHTIDPRTGRPITHALASVSVIDDLCVRADALATALEVLGPDEAYALALEHGWAAFLIIRDDAGAYREQSTPAFLVRAGLSAQ
jgi:thiamine biosynthesis lipoprotein